MTCDDKFPIYSHANSDSRYLFKLHPLLTHSPNRTIAIPHLQSHKSSGNCSENKILYPDPGEGGRYPRRPYVPVFQPTPQQIPHPLSSAIQNHLSYKIVCNPPTPRFPISPPPPLQETLPGKRGQNGRKWGKCIFLFFLLHHATHYSFFPLLFSHHFFFQSWVSHLAYNR